MSNLDTLVRLFIRTITINLIALGAMVRFYPEPFSLTMDPFSWLGKLVTEGGHANTRGFLMFGAAALFNAFMWKRFLHSLPAYRTGRSPGAWVLGRLVLAGFFLMAFPCDRFDGVHSTGAALVVGGLWAFTTGMLLVLKDKLGQTMHLGMQVALHAAALFCAVNFVLDSFLKGFSQRPLLAAIILETGICLNVLLRTRTSRGLTLRSSEAR